MSEVLSVSVIIPSHNRRGTLGRCLDSVLKQTVRPDAIILVDDGSTDGTTDWVGENYPQVTVIEQKNQGVSAARNAGIRKAETEWVAFLDSDDRWLPTKLEKQGIALKENPEYLVCHTEERWIFKGRERPVAEAYQKRGGWIFEHCLPVCALSPSATVMHRKVFEEVGLFDEGLPACEDYDLWLRITSRMPVWLVEEPLVEKHGGHADQLSNQIGLDKYRIQALQKILQNNSLNPKDRRLAKDRLRNKCRIYAKGLVKYGKAGEAEAYRRLGEQF